MAVGSAVGSQAMAPSLISLADCDTSDVVERIAEVLEAGGVVLLPTDTVYGLAALPGDRAATNRLFDLKGRTEDMPLAVLCADLTQALSLADTAVVEALAKVGVRWWPGPLTVVVPRRSGLRLHLGEPSTTVGLRVPDHDIVRAVAARVGPIAATSANRHGLPTPTTTAEVAAQLGPDIALIVDGGPLSTTASTVIAATADTWKILRDGPIAGADVLRVAHAAEADDR